MTELRVRKWATHWQRNLTNSSPAVGSGSSSFNVRIGAHTPHGRISSRIFHGALLPREVARQCMLWSIDADIGTMSHRDLVIAQTRWFSFKTIIKSSIRQVILNTQTFRSCFPHMVWFSTWDTLWIAYSAKNVAHASVDWCDGCVLACDSSVACCMDCLRWVLARKKFRVFRIVCSVTADDRRTQAH